MRREIQFGNSRASIGQTGKETPVMRLAYKRGEAVKIKLGNPLQAGKGEDAKAGFRRAARHVTTFYGQAAALQPASPTPTSPPTGYGATSR